MSRLLLVPLDDIVVFPGMTLTLAVDTGEEERVLLVPRHENEFAAVGTVAEINDSVRLPGGGRAGSRQGLHRGVAGAAQTFPDGRLFVEVNERLELALGYQHERLAELQVRKRIREDVESGAEKQQRECFLRKQMDSIRKELDEDDASVVEEYRTKIEQAGMPDHAREQAEKELGRLEKMGEQSAESSVIRTYLDWLIAVPWSKNPEERLDPVNTRTVLDEDHAGLEDVKDRIVEYIAVKKLRVDRGITEDKRSGAILTLIGPPGTGKTSIGESIARATGRKFVRMSLGGVRDEAEIRGHRRTYIGALPGRLVRALRDAGTMNPVIM